jgi:SAM-dependent methyltransferase
MSDYAWSGGQAYERYVGRWSRPVAAEFLGWLDVPRGSDWIDVGCGTGALTAAILVRAEPRRVRGYDLSPHYVAAAREQVRDSRVLFGEADARSLPEPAGGFQAAVSGLMLNFVPEPAEAVAEMKRVTEQGGTVAAYVWDYAEGMEMMRLFWDTAVDLDAEAEALDEGRRFGICRPDPLRELFESVGLQAVAVRAIDVSTRFESFEDYWGPFLGGQGPAPGYVAGLDEERRRALRARLEETLPRQAEDRISMVARAWAVRGRA